MRQLIAQVEQEFPLTEPSTFICGANTDCQGCPKKLLEMVDSEISYWQHALKRGVRPKFDELRKFARLCQSVQRNLARNHLLNSQRLLHGQGSGAKTEP